MRIIRLWSVLICQAKKISFFMEELVLVDSKIQCMAYFLFNMFFFSIINDLKVYPY